MFRLLAWALAVLVCSTSAWGDIYYVRTSGNDSNDGRSAATAFRTLSKAGSVARAGDTVYVGAGNHNGPISPARSGASGAAIVFAADTTGVMTGDAGSVVVKAISGVTVKLDERSHIEIRGFVLDGGGDSVQIKKGSGIRLAGCSLVRPTSDAIKIDEADVVLSDVTIERASGYGVLVESKSTLTMSGCSVRQSGKAGVLVKVTKGYEVRIDRCVFENNSAQGVQVESGLTIISSSLFKNNRSDGVTSIGSSADLRIWNCTIRLSRRHGVFVSAGQAEVINTIITHSTNVGVMRSGGTVDHRHNVYFQNRGGDYSGVAAHASNIQKSPGFDEDERLAAGSPAIDAGTSAAMYAPLDLDGKPRPIGNGFDIGCYEYGLGEVLAEVPFFDDFEDGGSALWSNSTTATQGRLGRFSGFFGRQGSELDAQSIGVQVTPEEDYVLFFDLFLFGRWQGSAREPSPDLIRVSLGGTTIFEAVVSTESFADSSMPFAPTSWGTSFGWGKGADWVYRRVRVDFKASGPLARLTFTGINADARTTASWAIDNVRIVTADLAAAYDPMFRDVAPFVGMVDHATTDKAQSGAGWHWADFDGDGRPDALLTGPKGRLYHNIGDKGFNSWEFGDVRRQVAVLDYDHDGDLDIWAVCVGGWNDERLFRNDGVSSTTGRIDFTDVGHRGFSAPSSNYATVAADISRNGWCDLVMFSTKGNFAGLHPGDPSWELLVEEPPTLGLGVRAASGNGDYCSSVDVNNDGVPDFFYHHAGGVLLLSQPDGTFAIETQSGISVKTSPNAPFGSAWGDFDGDGLPDLFVPSQSSSHPGWLWRNNGGTFTDVAGKVGITLDFVQISACWGDFDNNGWLDLFIVGEQRHALFLNHGGVFTLVEAGVEDGEVRALDCAAIDFDGDGLLDIAISYENHPPKLLRNQQHWLADRSLSVRAVGQGGPGKTNLAAVGVRVELLDEAGTALLARADLGGASGFGGSRPLVAHFGVDPARRYMVRVHFASGPVEVVGRASDWSTTFGSRVVERLLTVTEPERSNLVRRVLLWGEMTHDEQQLARDGVPLDERGSSARRPGGMSLAELIATLRRSGLSDAQIRELLGGDPSRPLGGYSGAFDDDRD
ncbi:MAG: VCBS repeat-containing protein [Phycisphaeraceae bacterium]|nr:VCBS repeat-containing protein [Phycisphaeraceae bacterium]